MKPQSTIQKDHVADEESLQQLLAAAYVLQEDRDRQARKPAPGSADPLSEIIETQRLVHNQQTDLQAAMALIAERALKIARASGVAVGIVENDHLVYRAATGNAAGIAGSRVDLHFALSAECLSDGQMLQCSDAENDSRLPPELCREQGVGSLIAVPVYREGKAAGVLELRFARVEAFQEQDVRASLLMAGLLTEALARAAEPELKPAEAAAIPQPAAVSQDQLSSQESAEPICAGCGRQFVSEERFCGTCGRPRPGSGPTTWLERISLPLQPAAAKSDSSERPLPTPQQPEAEPAASPVSLREIVTRFADEEHLPTEAKWTPSARTDPAVEADVPSEPSLASSPTEPAQSSPAVESDSTAREEEAISNLQSEVALRIVPADVRAITHFSPWASAQKAREWLELLRAEGPKKTWWEHQWQRNRANFYVAGAGLVLLLAILMFALSGTPPGSQSSGASASAAAASAHRRKKAPQLQLTWFERALVELGLAEPPPAPAYLGNPNTQVWVDVHTALYYCPGAELFGKTPGGKITTQQDAQRDQFEPASRNACD